MKRAFWSLPIALPLVVLLAVGFGHDPNSSASPLLDKRAPTFTLQSLDGKSVSLASLRGHPVVLNFWASWCTSCKDEHANLLQAWKTYGSKGIDFVGITFNDAPADSRAFLAQHGGGWTNVRDPNEQTAVTYGVSAVPETFLIDRNGVIRFKSTGPITSAGPVTPQIFNQQLRKLLTAPRGSAA